MTDEERMIAYEVLVQRWSGGRDDRREHTKQFVDVCLRDGPGMGTLVECAYCGLDLVKYDSAFVLDHIIPRYQGGPDTVENLVAACRDCNGLKGRNYVPPGDTREERVRNAKDEVRKRRADRVLRARYDVLAEMLRG